MIDLEHVSKEYKRGGPLALDDINLHVDDGEFVFLLGHSGAGKSTLLKLLLREELPSEGKVTVLGKDVASLHRHQVPYLRRQMGIIFQDFRLIPTMTVYENIAFAMHVTNVKRREISPRPCPRPQAGHCGRAHRQHRPGIEPGNDGAAGAGEPDGHHRAGGHP